jgi:SAM-dependent methyltransferase
MHAPADPLALPARADWAALRAAFVEFVHRDFTAWISPDQPHFAAQLEFAVSRFDEGLGLIRFFDLQAIGKPVVDVLDIGSGNGGITLAFANSPGYRIHGFDVVPNRHLTELQRRLGLPTRFVAGRGDSLPYASASFDVVLLVDVIEHVKERRGIGSEIMRVLRPGGLCLVSTAARLRFIHRPDPHYGVKGLLALPNGLQRFVVNRILRRKVVMADGRSGPAYDVEHTFWHVEEIAKLFPGRESAEGLYAFPMYGGPVFTREWLRRKLRRFLFDHVLVRKSAEGASRARDIVAPEVPP